MAAKEKAVLRAEMIERRNALPEDVRAVKSEQISEELIAKLTEALSGRAESPCVALYSPLGSEVRLDAFEAFLWDEGWRAAYPVMTKAGMVFTVPDLEDARAKELPYLAHPARTCEFAPELALDPRDIDAIVVPLVAFNAEGCRLGYGGGNYDRYLPQLREDALVIGAAFAEQRCDEFQAECFDARLAAVVTA